MKNFMHARWQHLLDLCFQSFAFNNCCSCFQFPFKHPGHICVSVFNVSSSTVLQLESAALTSADMYCCKQFSLKVVKTYKPVWKDNLKPTWKHHHMTHDFRLPLDLDKLPLCWGKWIRLSRYLMTRWLHNLELRRSWVCNRKMILNIKEIRYRMTSETQNPPSGAAQSESRPQPSWDAAEWPQARHQVSKE